ncbi:MAG TPA: putative toxin-antitoxin system toxin component, PIN family [Actinomycetota bacterium]|nr:putative toxin-antitoxin system toxin component, PIN family [Actinomycetota bacterium]
MRAVLDTDVLVSAFIFPGGAPEAAYRAAIEGRVELVTSPPLLAELGRVLSEKFGWEEGRVEEALAQVIRIGTLVRPRRALAVVRADPADDRVLEAALAGDAGVIVAGDRHLLALRSWRGIDVLDPRAFLERLART